MDYELEFHAVGDASAAGDAISLRYWDGAAFRVVVIDGGTNDAGEALISHIETYYGPHTVIDHMINSHPDSDHACGLRAVLEHFPVRNLWVHGLWHHVQEMLPFFSGQWGASGLEAQIRGSYGAIADLFEIAHAKHVPVREPFMGAQIGPLVVLSPSKWAYVRLVPQFRKTPAPNWNALGTDWTLSGPPKPATGNAIVPWVSEDWYNELLRDGAATYAENETSTVLLGLFGYDSFLLTADAGVWGLTWACDYAESVGLDLGVVRTIQVPHHGSRSNLTPSLLNRLIGPPVALGLTTGLEAVVSCPLDDSTHPRKMVLNAFRRRGALVYKTQGRTIRFVSGQMPARPSWTASEAFPWFGSVEQYD